MMECGIMKTTLLLFYFEKQLTCPGAGSWLLPVADKSGAEEVRKCARVLNSKKK